MFYFPWKIHSVAKGPPHNFLVEIEHKHLLELYERALVTVEHIIETTEKPKYSDSPGHYDYQKLKQDRDHYKEAIAWLEKLSA